MDLTSVIKLLGGLSLFFFGMSEMSMALEKTAGSKIENILKKTTGSLPAGMMTGAAVTGVIQSSSALTVMVVSFVDSGIMTLKQATGVILGANIGTTVTGQLLRLDNTSNAGTEVWLEIFMPSNFAYIIIFMGILFYFLSKNKKHKNIGEVLMGLGILFIGMSTMESAVSGLSDAPAVKNLFFKLQNPAFGFLYGIIITALIQSSSASVGMLQAMSVTGALTYSAAIPVILGQNIGTCVTALLSAVGAGKNAKCAAMIHLYFNLFGALIFLFAIYALHFFVPFLFFGKAVGKGAIADIHTIFNVVSVMMFMPFSDLLIKLAETTVKRPANKKEI